MIKLQKNTGDGKRSGQTAVLPGMGTTENGGKNRRTTIKKPMKDGKRDILTAKRPIKNGKRNEMPERKPKILKNGERNTVKTGENGIRTVTETYTSKRTGMATALAAAALNNDTKAVPGTAVKSGFILVILEKYFRENFGKTAKKLDKPRITCYSLVGLQ